jgi:hypothetical protein
MGLGSFGYFTIWKIIKVRRGAAPHIPGSSGALRWKNDAAGAQGVNDRVFRGMELLSEGIVFCFTNPKLVQRE